MRILIIIINCLMWCTSFGQNTNGAGSKYDGEFIGGINSKGVNSFSNVSVPKKAKVVGNAVEFLNAISKANPGDIIYIKENSIIDLTGKQKIEISSGLTILGNRGENGSKGPLIFTNSNGVHPLFEVLGDNVSFIGLRIKGSDGEVFYKGYNAFKGISKAEKDKNYMKLYNKTMYASPVSSGIATKKNNLVVKNCELYNWTYTAIYLQKGASNAKISHNYIHNNQRFGLGYGVTIDQSEGIIIGNLFNFNRHSIASTGRQGSTYTAEFNIFKADGNETWAVDVHGGKDWGKNSNEAGELFVVRNNTFYLKGTGQAVVIRGFSSKPSIVENNEIIQLDKNNRNPIEQKNAKGNFSVKNNFQLKNGVRSIIK